MNYLGILNVALAADCDTLDTDDSIATGAEASSKSFSQIGLTFKLFESEYRGLLSSLFLADEYFL